MKRSWLLPAEAVGPMGTMGRGEEDIPGVCSTFILPQSFKCKYIPLAAPLLPMSPPHSEKRFLTWCNSSHVAYESCFLAGRCRRMIYPIYLLPAPSSGRVISSHSRCLPFLTLPYWPPQCLISKSGLLHAADITSTSFPVYHSNGFCCALFSTEQFYSIITGSASHN